MPGKKPIKDYMTQYPHSIGQEQTLAVALAVMKQYGVRHLPVLHGGELVGVISQRDIQLVQSFPDVKIDQVPVEEAIAAEPYAVSPDTELSEVVGHMAEQKLGSAVVMDNHRVTGMFTTIDALTVLHQLLLL